MSEGKVKAAKVKVYPPPPGVATDTHVHVYVFDAFHKTFLAGRSFDTTEKAVSFQRHEQERIYAEQEADPEWFDLPFLSGDPDLLKRIESDDSYKTQLLRDLGADARARARKR